MINKKIYIGQTNNIKKRWSDHCSKKSECRKLKNAIQKYGKKNFKIECIEALNSREEANLFERLYIEMFNTINNGYNIALSGINTPPSMPKSEETRKKISSALKGRAPNSGSFKKGQISPNKGKTHSAEAKAKMFKSRTGKKLTEEHRKNISNSSKNKIHWTEDQIKEILKLISDGLSMRKIAKSFGVVHTTISKLLRDLKKGLK